MFLKLAHTQLDIFTASKEFVLSCYKETKTFPPDERFCLTQQIRRAATSVHLNIAEGWSRKSEAERKRFFEVARGSVIEVDTAIDIAISRGYLEPGGLNDLGNLSLRFQMLSKLVSSNK